MRPIVYYRFTVTIAICTVTNESRIGIDNKDTPEYGVYYDPVLVQDVVLVVLLVLFF
jgi:hypothetical protein